MLALAAGIQHPRQVQTPTPCLHFQKTPCLHSPCLLGALPPHEWPRLVLPRPWFIGWEPQPARCKPLAQGGHACPRGGTPRSLTPPCLRHPCVWVQRKGVAAGPYLDLVPPPGIQVLKPLLLLEPEG